MFCLYRLNLQIFSTWGLYLKVPFLQNSGTPGFLHHNIAEILLKVALSTITLLVRHRDNYPQQFYHIYTVKPVLRGHIWDKGNVVL